MSENQKSYVDYCKDFATEELKEMKGYDNSEYGCDLGNKITESINMTGSVTCSTYEAKECIKDWWDEAGQVQEYQKANYGECLHNPFENPEAFHVVMVIEGVNNIMSQCKTIQDSWNDSLDLTDEIVDKIIEEIEMVSEIEF